MEPVPDPRRPGVTWAVCRRGLGRVVMAGMLLCVVVLVAFALLAWYLLNKPLLVDFMIATEAEMKKVNWPSRREIKGSTIVVIGGTFLLTMVLFVVDLVFGYIFQKIDILEG